MLYCWRRRGRIGASYCIGGSGERNNRQVVESICALMDRFRPEMKPHGRLITLVGDRPGHDRRYAIDPTVIRNELGWQPSHTFEQGLSPRCVVSRQPWLVPSSPTRQPPKKIQTADNYVVTTIKHDDPHLS